MSTKYFVWSLILSLLIQSTVGVLHAIIPPVVGALLGTIGQRIISTYYVKCACCNDRWVKPRIDTLVPELNENVYGQHLAIDVIAQSLQDHTKDKNPKKNLVLLMHGGPGTGKTYISQLVIDHLYGESDKKKFVHLFAANKDFPPEGQIQKYKEDLITFINHAVQECPHSLFIFDEVDEMPSGLIDAAIDTCYKSSNSGAIFLLLSSTTGTNMNTKVLEHLEAGHKREDLTLQEMDKTVELEALEENLWYTRLLLKDQISEFVPFLPLERHHVMNCTRKEIRGQYIDASHDKEELVNMVTDELRYVPAQSKRFSKYGCKLVAKTLRLILEDY